MWKNIVQSGRPQMTISHKRIACWIPKATNTHSDYVILIAFPMQKLLGEGASMLRYTHAACLPDFVSVFMLDALYKLCSPSF